MENENWKEVDFYTYCAKCKHKDEVQTDVEESIECHDCLNDPCRLYTCKPLNYEED